MTPWVAKIQRTMNKKLRKYMFKICIRKVKTQHLKIRDDLQIVANLSISFTFIDYTCLRLSTKTFPSSSCRVHLTSPTAHK